MTQFPASLPTFTALDPNATLAANNHANRHNKVHDELSAVAAKVGTTGSGDTASLDYKLGLVTSAARAESQANKDTDTSLTANSDTKYPSQKAIKAYVDAAITAYKAAEYPVGALYFSTLSTNPATLLGFGTWIAFAAGQTIIGVGTSDQSFAAAATGGESAHTLTSAEQASMNIRSSSGPGAGNDTLGVSFSTNANAFVSFRATLDAVNANSYSGPIQAVGGGAAHNNLPPYIVVYIWKRTA